MKLIKPSFEILHQSSGLDGVYKQIEIAGRTCYKSEDKITEDSAKEFIDRLVKSGHGAMLEHGTVYLKVDVGKNFVTFHKKYFSNKYSVAKFIEHTNICCITTNYRVLVENNWLGDLQYICEPTEFHEKRYTVKFVCDRGVSHEFVRHRVFSFAQESTRYCNYSKDKFGNELTFIQPCWSLAPMSPEDYNGSRFLEFLHESEDLYLSLIKEGWKPQEARAILPNALKTELVMTGFTSDWKHFFELRDASSAHPQARELAQPLHEEFIKRRYL